jgi:hypothetical protein
MLLAIDPGTKESAYVLMDGYKPYDFGKVSNDWMADILHDNTFDEVVIEMIASFGMAVGAEVFETCVQIGRFMQIASERKITCYRITRHEIKQAICHSVKANDATIKQALVDRFAYNVPNHGKGSKKERGWFYGFSADVWAAYALAIVHQDRSTK